MVTMKGVVILEDSRRAYMRPQGGLERYGCQGLRAQTTRCTEPGTDNEVDAATMASTSGVRPHRSDSDEDMAAESSIVVGKGSEHSVTCEQFECLALLSVIAASCVSPLAQAHDQFSGNRAANEHGCSCSGSGLAVYRAGGFLMTGAGA